ncbi:MAG: tRNA 5-methoxyuridine(34)/uridine 5-oxyacetic acid(34) synthase CmoB [Kangiellaceae bacterium]|nr:tRNA 5-methoxyuridine(34)/uridine 5-oxyacetic acid(34) synthase CmoB [Kangiellaceae bacterium]
MINILPFEKTIAQTAIAPWLKFLLDAVEQRYQSYTHGELDQWKALIEELPDLPIEDIEIQERVSVTTSAEFDESMKQSFVKQLKVLHPWRKGPFHLMGVDIETEWRSDWKWERIRKQISPLKNRTVLDVGCGNGYHCWRMLGDGARWVLGIDPSQKFLAQFTIMQKYLRLDNCHMLPLGIEDMPTEMGKHSFDSVFCMGVLYHQKSPIQLLYQLKNLLRAKGELILETLVIDGDHNTLLVPHSRYAQMRNVWFLPSTKMLEIWLEKCGFVDIKTIDVNQTSLEEQRTTDWMTFHSLENFLDAQDTNKTIEGYPAPKRATIIATKRA